MHDGIITCQIAAHAAALLMSHPGAQLRDKVLFKACLKFHWEDQFGLGLDRVKARGMHDETMPTDAH